MIIFLISVLTLIYACLLLYFLLGAQRLYRKSPVHFSNSLPFISVVVPLRNEEQTLSITLKALSKQDYEGEWEVICVNDRSTDNTREMIAGFCSKNSHFRMLDVDPKEPGMASPKKRALQKGFDVARGVILMTTDADCEPPRGWLSSMARNFTDSIGIVQGPKKITGPDGLLTRYQKLEVFGLVSIEAASFALGNPLLASAPSLAYRKSLYEHAGGFSGMEHLVSGDDDMLVHKMANLPGVNVRYNLDIQACVSTAPAHDWLSLLRQRARWASNGTHYQSKPYVCLLISIFAFYLWLFVSPVLALTGVLSWGYFLLPFTVKVSLEYLFLLQTSRKFRQHKILRDIWWSEFVHVPITLTAAVMGLMGWYRWK